MTTTWNNVPKRSSSNSTGRLYDVSGLLYNVAGTLYQGSYDATAWTLINKSS